MKDGAAEVRAARHVALGLGSTPLTLAYWSAIALYAAALALPRFPAVVDYPQHLAVSSLLRRSYPVVLVHAREGEAPTKDVFGEDAPRVILLARHGPFWLFDTAQVQARPGVL